MSKIYLAYNCGGAVKHTFQQMDREGDWDSFDLGMLVAFPELHLMRNLKKKVDLRPDGWMLDSGAFALWQSGRTVDIDLLIEETKREFWDESVALDVIGDAQSSLENALKMKAAGSPAFPVFHYGDPMEHLDTYFEHFDKVGLSCRFGESVKESMGFLGRCFARHWPARYHSFGWVTRRMLFSFPFESADTAIWNRGPTCWGQWNAAYGGKMSVAVPSRVDLRAQIEAYSQMQRELRWRWRKELYGGR